MTTSHVRSTFYPLSRSLLLGTLASLFGILGGIVPDFTAEHPSSLFASAAQADEFSDSELRNYAAALMEIEPIRQSSLSQVSRANGGALPNLICNQPETMEGLTREAKDLFVEYCEKCSKIAARKEITIDRFNQITQAVRANPQLQNRVRNFMNN